MLEPLELSRKSTVSMNLHIAGKSDLCIIKTGYNDNGPVWIANIEMSKSGQTIYFNGKALKKIRRGGISRNCQDIESGDEYWISNVKKNGLDRHWSGSGKTKIQTSIVGEYLEIIGSTKLNPSIYERFEPDKRSIKDKIHEIENRKL